MSVAFKVLQKREHNWRLFDAHRALCPIYANSNKDVITSSCLSHSGFKDHELFLFIYFKDMVQSFFRCIRWNWLSPPNFEGFENLLIRFALTCDLSGNNSIVIDFIKKNTVFIYWITEIRLTISLLVVVFLSQDSIVFVFCALTVHDWDYQIIFKIRDNVSKNNRQFSNGDFNYEVK